MGSYNIFFDKDVEKDLSKIPKPDARKIMLRISKLSGSPRPPQSLKIEHSETTYRLSGNATFKVNLTNSTA